MKALERFAIEDQESAFGRTQKKTARTESEQGRDVAILRYSGTNLSKSMPIECQDTFAGSRDE